MLTLLLYVLIVGLVAALLFLVASAVFGRGEEMGPLPEGTTATVLPAARIRGADVRALRFQQVFRGYKAGEVDWALSRLAARIDELEAQLGYPEGPGARPDGTSTHTGSSAPRNHPPGNGVQAFGTGPTPGFDTGISTGTPPATGGFASPGTAGPGTGPTGSFPTSATGDPAPGTPTQGFADTRPGSGTEPASGTASTGGFPAPAQQTGPGYWAPAPLPHEPKYPGGPR